MHMGKQPNRIAGLADFLHPAHGTQNEVAVYPVGGLGVTTIHHRHPFVVRQVGELAGIAVGGKHQAVPAINRRDGNQTGVGLTGAFRASTANPTLLSKLTMSSRGGRRQRQISFCLRRIQPCRRGRTGRNER